MLQSKLGEPLLGPLEHVGIGLDGGYLRVLLEIGEVCARARANLQDCPFRLARYIWAMFGEELFGAVQPVHTIVDRGEPLVAVHLADLTRDPPRTRWRGRSSSRRCSSRGYCR